MLANKVRDAEKVRAELAEREAGETVELTEDGGVRIKLLKKAAKDAEHGAVENPFVEVHYRGFLEDTDEMFDSSRDTGYPMVVHLGTQSVIPGWEVALQVIRVGELAEVIIQKDYGYGDEAMDDIPAGSTLKFEIEVLDARKTPKAVAPIDPNVVDPEVERLAEIRRERERQAKRREEEKKIAEEKKKAAADNAAQQKMKLANKGQKGGKGKGKKKG